MGSFYYVYAIVRREARIPPELRGLHEAALSMVAWQDLAAVISPIESATVPTIPACLLRHEEVVEALCRAGPTLPVRFGTILADQAAVARAIAEKYEVLLADLERVGDKVELGLTILWNTQTEQEAQTEQQLPMTTASPARRSSGSGTRYLESRLAYYRRETAQQSKARSVIADLEQVCRPYILEQRYRVLSSPRLAVRAAYLIQPRQIRDFQHAVDEMREKRPDLRWLLSGPWPPYSFVTGAGVPFQQSAGLKLDGTEEQGGIS
jgi:hypothetical protein